MSKFRESDERLSFGSFASQLISKSFSQRLIWVKGFILFIVATVLVRSIYLQVVTRDTYEKFSETHRKNTARIRLARGPILDSNGNILAASIPMQSIFAIPPQIEDLETTAYQMSKALDIPLIKTIPLLSADKSFVWLKRFTPPSVSNRIKELNLQGIHFLKEYQRFYPLQNLASQLIGFRGPYPEAREGIESKFDAHLAGRSSSTGDAWQQRFFAPVRQPRGGSLTLSITEQLQYYTELELGRAVEKMKAKAGVAIIMSPQTGAVLAMANKPDFNPNYYYRFDPKRMFNRAVGDSYEPGSTFKIITLASALELGSVEENELIYCEDGAYQVEDRVIRDIVAYPELTLKEIVQKSSNIGAVKIAEKMEKEDFHEMIRKFGFGKLSGIDLPGESTGRVPIYAGWTNVDRATISFGHSIAATPIQLIKAINTIAADGILVQPTVIKAMTNPDGSPLDRPRQKKTRVIRTEVARKMREYMISVTQKGGTGVLARIPGVEVAGKTGTARKFDQAIGAYSTESHVVSFVGFFPADAPKFTILVILNEPRKQYLGTKGAAPVFREIGKHAMRILKREKTKPEILARDEENFDSIFSSARITKKIKFKNLTLREALTKSTANNIPIKISGSGIVVSEKIVAGPDGPVYHLKLK